MLLLASLRNCNQLVSPVKCYMRKITRRCLSVNQVATALRPFYFQVHPDLFGQYPNERAVNEESLKILSQYLASLQNPQRRVKPLTLRFFTKKPDLTQCEDCLQVNSIEIALSPNSIRACIEKILQTSHLPLDYLSTLPEPDQTAAPDRPIMWDPTFYAQYGLRNPYAQEEIHKPKEQLTQCLSSWLQKNTDRARGKVEAQEPIRLQNERLKQVLINETGVLDVRWECGWSINQYRACMKGFLRLWRQKKEEFKHIRGHNLVFGNQTGICIRGDVILRKDDVPDHWLPLLQSIHKHDVILNKLPASENFISALLGGIQILRPGQRSVTLAEAYLMQLRRMIMSTREFLEQNPAVTVQGPLDDLELVIESATGPTSISPSGKIIVPSSSPGFLVVNFINKNGNKARQIQRDYNLDQEFECDVIEKCREKLGILELTRESDVSGKHMRLCCSRLLTGFVTGALDIDLSGCKVKVDSFYSVMSDGEMHIPWDWADDSVA